ncbi:MAG TPA: hypothetical protein VFZ00_11935 [Solirubrobacter sp.]|jgi:hypothetical protein|nr:hypothetical protein [Solirubrobacter sp.]
MTATPELDRFHDGLREEYRELLAIVSAYDQRLLVIKGWGVTLSLANLGFGFQQDHYGLFLVAALSGLAFWVLEATTKLHQTRYYPRMGDIEVLSYELFSVPVERGRASTPLIDWGWTTARQRLRRPRHREAPMDPHTPTPRPNVLTGSPMRPWLWPHVMLPHAISVVAGIVLFVLGLAGVFGPI